LNNSDPIIRVVDLQMAYGDKTVLRGLNLDVPRGQILGYIGPNGAGKTTTVKILCGMLVGYRGRASVCGLDVATQTLEVKRRIGYVPESAALYDLLTPLEYLSFVGRLHGLAGEQIETRARDLLGLFDLSAELDKQIATFSKGMRQKVLLVAGLLHNPDVIFMDEPLSGLDASSALLVKEIITRLAALGRTVFYCSHVMDVVERVCDRIVILNEGRIVADGTFEQLQTMNKGTSLEHIFTTLTSAGGQAATADRFVEALETLDAGHD
jgi:ABC-2 type transport system ATP-binding protein